MHVKNGWKLVWRWRVNNNQSYQKVNGMSNEDLKGEKEKKWQHWVTFSLCTLLSMYIYDVGINLYSLPFFLSFFPQKDFLYSYKWLNKKKKKESLYLHTHILIAHLSYTVFLQGMKCFFSVNFNTNESLAGNVGFSVLPNDTLTCGREKEGIEPPSYLIGRWWLHGMFGVHYRPLGKSPTKWKKVLWLYETKTELFCRQGKCCMWANPTPVIISRTPAPQCSKVVVALCCGHTLHWRDLRNGLNWGNYKWC